MNLSTEDTKNLKYIFLFLGVFTLVLLISLIVKSVRTVQESSFTGNVFNILYVSDEYYIIHTNKADNKIRLLEIAREGAGEFVGKAEAYSTYLGVPIHAYIVDNQQKPITDINSVFTFANSINLTSNNRFLLKGLNAADVFKIYMINRSRIKDNTSSEQFKYKSFTPENYAVLDERLYDTIKDLSIVNRKISVEVVNATDYPGMASRVARVMENWGYDAVLVIGDKKRSQKSKIIMRFEDPIIYKDLITVFSLPITVEEEQSISDITIIVADDALKKFVF